MGALHPVYGQLERHRLHRPHADLAGCGKEQSLSAWPMLGKTVGFTASPMTAAGGEADTRAMVVARPRVGRRCRSLSPAGLRTNVPRRAQSSPSPRLRQWRLAQIFPTNGLLGFFKIRGIKRSFSERPSAVETSHLGRSHVSSEYYWPILHFPNVWHRL